MPDALVPEVEGGLSADESAAEYSDFVPAEHFSGP